MCDTNESNASSKNKQTIESTDFDDFTGLG
jgi:hypothetical protein